MQSAVRRTRHAGRSGYSGQGWTRVHHRGTAADRIHWSIIDFMIVESMAGCIDF